jgi:phospholipid/cholesterol/gamma-HCH transport system substrate-binding protein
MSDKLSRWQAIVLGVVVLAGLAIGGAGLLAVASKQGYGRETFALSVGFPEAHDIAPGTPVRVRGVDAGQVVAVDYPDSDGPIQIRMQIDTTFRNKLFADAKAQVQPTGLLGSKVLNILPGTPAAGPFLGESLAAMPTPDIASLATEGEAALKDIRGMVGDVRGALKKVDGIVATEAGNVRGLVQDGRETIQSVKQNSEAVSRLPIVRNYVENATAMLVRPDCRSEAMTYDAADIFEPDSAILSDDGKTHLRAVALWMKNQPNSNTEAVVVCGRGGADASQPNAIVEHLTRKQAEVALEYLKANGAHKMGWWSRRKVSALGLGRAPSPAVESEKAPANFLRVFAFTPQ